MFIRLTTGHSEAVCFKLPLSGDSNHESLVSIVITDQSYKHYTILYYYPRAALAGNLIRVRLKGQKLQLQNVNKICHRLTYLHIIITLASIYVEIILWNYFLGWSNEEELLRGRVEGRGRARQGHGCGGQGQRPQKGHDQLLPVDRNSEEARRKVVGQTGGARHQVIDQENNYKLLGQGSINVQLQFDLLVILSILVKYSNFSSYESNR